MTREQQVAEALIEAADILVDGFDPAEFLQSLAARCVQLLDVDAAGVMLADHRGTLHASAASTENARLLALFEISSDAGPCLDAFRTGAAVVNADLSINEARWPRYAEAVQATGFAEAHALPLRLRGTVLGALNLLSTTPGPLSDQDARTGQALADMASIGIISHRSLQRSELLATQLQQAMTSRAIIEQAKGVLAERWTVTADEAFALLRNHARNYNLRLSDLARDVTDRSGTVAVLLRDPDQAGTDN